MPNLIRPRFLRRAASVGVILGAMTLGVLAAPTKASGAVFFVVRGDTHIGSFPVKRDGTLGGAIWVFGEPTTLRKAPYRSCTGTWPEYGLTIDFFNLEGLNPCSPDHGYVSRAVMHGKRWRTASGLRIGMQTRSIQRFHPRAKWHRGQRHFWPSGWWLVTRRYPTVGGGPEYPGLLAETRNGRVFAFHVHIGAAE
jgi:hypothetical protein